MRQDEAKITNLKNNKKHMKIKKYFCHDCKKQLTKDEKVIPFEVEGDCFIKCEKCYQKDPNLRNFRKTEVYSRVVGYIRPTNQWNEGKREEFDDRKTYKANPGCC